jgi:uncharacterized protein (DUF4415 family)
MSQDQFELQPYVDPVPKRKGRGLGKKDALTYIGIRIEKEVLDFYNKFPNRQAVIREALKQYIEQDRKERLNAD